MRTTHSAWKLDVMPGAARVRELCGDELERPAR